MKASEAARAAAEWFTDNPWGRHASYDQTTGAMCIRGALLYMLTGNAYGESVQAYSSVTDAFGWRVRDSTVGYNDASGRTVDEVIHTLKLVAEDLELQGL